VPSEHQNLDGAIQVASGPPTGWPADALHVEVLAEPLRIDRSLQARVDKWRLNHSGEESSSKLAVTTVVVSDRGLNIQLAPTSWRDVRPFHEPPALPAEAVCTLTSTRVDIHIPNIASAHVVVRTADNRLILGQRGDAVHYHPRHWSVSLEEGCEPPDAEIDPLVFRATAVRGINEELAEVDSLLSFEHVRLLSVVLERPWMNPAFVLFADVPISSDAILGSRPMDREEFVAGRVVTVSAERKILMKLIASTEWADDGGRSPWHPTSRWRLVAAIRHMFGDEAGVEAFRQAGRRA
jgi:hypothetical protein